MRDALQNPSAARWRPGLLAALYVAALALFPQLYLWAAVGGWQGSYVMAYGDEAVYSAYVAALAEGRPRRNDPFTGSEDRPGAPLQESHLSVQFLPAYALALPARALGGSTATAFIALSLVASLASALALFWLLLSLTVDGRLSGAGALFVLCFGTLAAWQGFGPLLFGREAQFTQLLFLRRYQPAAAFPLLFVFCALAWRALTVEEVRTATAWGACAGVTLALLVLSYFYLWSAAAAWLGCATLLWLAARRGEWRRVLLCWLTVALPTLCALVPYVLMLSNRPRTMDVRQTLELTRAPDLLRAPELIGAVTVVALVFHALRGTFDPRRPQFLFALSFALTPFVVFNQQVLTGRSVQPFHYEVFVVNYLSLVGVAVCAALMLEARGANSVKAHADWMPPRESVTRRKLLRLVTAAAVLWGAVEVVPATLVSKRYALHDSVVPVALHLKERALAERALKGSREKEEQVMVVASNDLLASTMLPTYAPLAVLYSPYLLDFPVVSAGEFKERFYKSLYYSGVDEGRLRQALSGESGERSFDEYSRYALLGHERVSPLLSRNFRPATLEEANAEAHEYAEFAARFSRADAAGPELTYFIAADDAPTDFSNLDRWYQRDAGERVGRFVIYRVKLKD
jgi:hypothetical protein